MKITQLTISGFERSILISLYLEAFRLVLKVNSVPSLVMYWTENKKKNSTTVSFGAYLNQNYNHTKLDVTCHAGSTRKLVVCQRWALTSYNQ